MKWLIGAACIAVIASAALFFYRDHQAHERQARLLAAAQCRGLLQVAIKDRGNALEPHPFRFTNHPLHEATAKCMASGDISTADWAQVTGGQRFIPMQP